MSVRSEYYKQRRRIQSLVSSYRRKGFDVQYEIPAIPKRITQASVRRLKKVTPAVVRQRTYGVDVETGEQISFFKASQQRREALADIRRRRRIEISTGIDIPVRTPSFSNVIIESFRMTVANYPPTAMIICLQWLDQQISKFGEVHVAEMLQKSADAGMWLERKEAYDKEKVRQMLTGMMDIMKLTPSQQKEFLRAFDEEYNEEELF